MSPSQEQPNDVALLQSAIRQELLVNADVHEELRSITASAEGSVFYALDVVVVAPLVIFLKTWAELLAKDTYSAVKAILARRQVIVGDGSTRVVIDSDLPPEALRYLAQPLPAAPSGELVWNQDQGAWVDALFGIAKPGE